METKQRLVDGPTNDYLTQREVALYLRMSSRTLKRLIEQGRFPRPFTLSPGTKVWAWREIMAYAILREIRHRYRKEPVDNDGQSRTNPGQSRTTGRRDRLAD